MRQFVPVLLVFVVAAIARGAAPHTPSSTQPADVAAALKAAKGIALIEVTAVKEKDDRPSDGNLVATVTFKTIKSTGALSKKEMGKVIGALKQRPEAPLIDFGAVSKLVQAKLP